MTDSLRVLVSCPHAWAGLSEYEEAFASRGIGIVIPDVPGQALSESELMPVIGDFDGIIAGDDHLSRSVLERASRLRVISKWGVGVDAIDLDAAREFGIVVLNTPGMFGDELADYAAGFLLLLARSQHLVDLAVRRGEWPHPRGRSLAGLTLGVVGVGSSGSALALRSMAFGMAVLGFDPNVRDGPSGVSMVGFEQLLERCDAISLHLPLTNETRHLIDRPAIDRMRDGVWLINTARGDLIDEAALLSGIESGKIGAAALDVFSTEPLPVDHPLLGYPNIVVGSHNGSNTHEAVLRTTRQAVDNLLAALAL